MSDCWSYVGVSSTAAPHPEVHRDNAKETRRERDRKEVGQIEKVNNDVILINTRSVVRLHIEIAADIHDTCFLLISCN